VKAQKVSRIGIVVSGDTVRAAQRVEGGVIRAQVSIGDDELKRGLRKLLSSSPFVGRKVVIGLEGSSVLVESLAVPPGSAHSPHAVCRERLKGDPVFNGDRAALGVANVPAQGAESAGMVVLAAVNRERIAEVMQACRELSLEVHSVEAAALAAWRFLPGDGMQVRLLRGDQQDVVQAGVDGRLLFCRVVNSPMPLMELRATITRVASLLGGRFDKLLVSGPVDAELAALCRSLDLELDAPPEDIEDPCAVGLATDGQILTEFTPPEEISRRAARRVRKVSFAMAGAGVALLLVAGVLAFQHLSGLRTEEMGLKNEIANLDTAQMELTELRGRLAEVIERRERVTDAVPGHLTSRLWALLLNKAPESLFLETASVEDRVDNATSGRQLAVKLAGLAADGDSVRAYAEGLLDSGAFANVRVDTSERVLLDGGVEGERFRITATAETR
jgi:Tfp pilus assembly protein PilN